MGHFTLFYGYISAYYTEKENIDSFITLEKEKQTSLSKMVFGPYDCVSSGFCTYSICGEVKEYIDVDPTELISEILHFLSCIRGVSAVIHFDSELQLYPEKIEYIYDHSNGWQLIHPSG